MSSLVHCGAFVNQLLECLLHGAGIGALQLYSPLRTIVCMTAVLACRVSEA